MFRVIPRHRVDLDRRDIALLAGTVAGIRPSGDAVRAFEEALAAYLGVRHVVTLSSGRTALCACLDGLGLPAGSEVVVPAYTFFTIPDVVAACGFVPVFAPCDPGTYAIDPERLAACLSPRTSAVVVIDPFGQAAPLREIADVASRRGVRVIEDFSQSIGASLEGRKLGSLGTAGCASLVHGKNLTALGGGVATTDDDDVYRRILARPTAPPQAAGRKMAAAGLAKWALATRAGFTLGPFLPFWALNLIDRARLDRVFEEPRVPFSPAPVRPMTDLQAELASSQLATLDVRNALRRGNAEAILDGVRDLPGLGLPRVVPGTEATWNSLPVRVADAARLQRNLLVRGVDTRADYMSVCAFETEWQAHGSVCYLPNHPGMGPADTAHVVDSVRRALRR